MMKSNWLIIPVGFLFLFLTTIQVKQRPAHKKVRKGIKTETFRLGIGDTIPIRVCTNEELGCTMESYFKRNPDKRKFY